MSCKDLERGRAPQELVRDMNENRHSRRSGPVSILWAVLLVGGLGLSLTCASPALADGVPKTFSGKVSWYGPGFNGKKTASGELFDMKKSTAAHLKLKFGTKVLVENPRTGKTVVVKVNDRGPYAKGRIMDLSRGAAEKLGTLLGGLAFVDCTVLDKDAPEASMLELRIITDESTKDGLCIALIPLPSSQNARI